MIKNVWILKFSWLKVFVVHHLEYEAKDSCKELGGIRIVGSNFGWINLFVNEMNNVHFKVHQFPVNGVFSWRMEMKLLCIEVSFWNVLVEKTDGGSFHVIECLKIISWLLGIHQRENEWLTALVELVRVLRINCLVVEFEVCVFKILLNGHLGLDVDWSTSHTWWISVLLEAFSRSLGDMVLVGLWVVVLEIMFMILDTVWNTEWFIDHGISVYFLAVCLIKLIDSILVNSVLFHGVKHSLLQVTLWELTKSHDLLSLQFHVLTLIFFLVLSKPFSVPAVSLDFCINALKHLWVQIL